MTGPPLAVGLGLPGHRALHGLGQRHVLDLDAVDLHAPADGRAVDHQLQTLVQLLPVGQQVVEVALLPMMERSDVWAIWETANL